MKVEKFKVRENYIEKLIQDRFFFWNSDNEYWIEDEALIFTQKEADEIVKATKEIHDMGKDFIGDIIKRGDYYKFSIHKWPLNIEEIEKSWNEDSFSLFGRFDIGFKNGLPKILEYNADTPVTYLECSKVQENWYQNKKDKYGQFNKMQQALLDRWKYFKTINKHDELIHLMCETHIEEEVDSCNYMASLLEQVGLRGKVISNKNFSLDYSTGEIFDQDEVQIKNLYKIIPWDFIWQEDWGHLMGLQTTAIEPAWKALLNDKILLAYLWEKYPNHPYLLETVVDINDLKPETTDFVIKPIEGREGNNIKMFKNGELTSYSIGLYGASPMIYQERCDAIHFNGYNYGIGSWIVGDEPAAIGVRKDTTEIIHNNSLFLSHLID